MKILGFITCFLFYYVLQSSLKILLVVCQQVYLRCIIKDKLFSAFSFLYVLFSKLFSHNIILNAITNNSKDGSQADKTCNFLLGGRRFKTKLASLCFLNLCILFTIRSSVTDYRKCACFLTMSSLLAGRAKSGNNNYAHRFEKYRIYSVSII